MSGIEKRLGIIKDIVLPLDSDNRYDLYFTDRRIAIIYMGRVDRFNDGSFGVRSFPSASAAVTPPLTYVENRSEVEKIEEELSGMPVSDVLKLSKRNCYYMYDEIEELRLVWGKKPKFVILSEDSESKFAPDEAQFKKLIELLSTIESLSDKLEVAGSWKDIQEILTKVICNNCGVGNDLDVVCCVNCGEKLKAPEAPDSSSISCGSCGTKNRSNSSFCKQCGAALAKNNAGIDDLEEQL